MPDWLDRPTPSFLDIKPSRTVLKRLAKKEFLELWHFTAEGCRNAAAVDLATPDDTFGLVNTDKGLLFQNIGASAASTKAINDENLTWNQLTEAKTRMIGCRKECRWKSYEIERLILFYVSLDVHPMRSQPYGLEAIMRYQQRVRQDWTTCLSSGTLSLTITKSQIFSDIVPQKAGPSNARSWRGRTLIIFFKVRRGS